MPPEADLFGPGAPKTRFAPGTREQTRPWTTQEDLCLFPVLLACQSEGAYIEACRFLCDTLGRSPRLSGKPLESELGRAAVSLIERRTVTSTLSGTPGKSPVTTMAVYLFEGRRTEPFTWAEIERFIRPWHVKPTTGRIPLPSLQILLERRAAFKPQLEAYARMDKIPHSGPQFAHGSPARFVNRKPLAAAVLAFRDVSSGDEHALVTAWHNLHTAATS